MHEILSTTETVNTSVDEIIVLYFRNSANSTTIMADLPSGIFADRVSRYRIKKLYKISQIKSALHLKHVKIGTQEVLYTLMC